MNVIWVEMGLVLTLLYKNPVRNLVILGLDQLKQRSWALMVENIVGGAKLFLIFICNLYVVMYIQKRSTDSGLVDPADELLMEICLLEASLIG